MLYFHHLQFLCTETKIRRQQSAHHCNCCYGVRFCFQRNQTSIFGWAALGSGSRFVFLLFGLGAGRPVRLNPPCWRAVTPKVNETRAQKSPCGKKMLSRAESNRRAVLTCAAGTRQSRRKHAEIRRGSYIRQRRFTRNCYQHVHSSGFDML